MIVVYDAETFPNCFTLAAEHVDLPITWAFEISDYRNDSREIIEWVESLTRMIGFNNIGFDYPVLHCLLKMGYATAGDLYEKAMAIISSHDDEDGDRWAHQVYPSDRRVEQIDLFKIHHFDNKARSTSLKALEFNMRMGSIQDLPFPVGTHLNREQIALLKTYNAHDVTATKLFWQKSIDMVRFREELTRKYKRDFLNHNDTKIGKDYFTMELEKAGVQCYKFGPSGRQPIQTPRPVIHLRDAILPWIEFREPEFQRVLGWLKGQSITETKGVFKDLTATVNGFTFVFGLGGIHGSIENETVWGDDTDWVILDLDVTSYYPSLAIEDGFYPHHLGEKFCAIYADLKARRVGYKKGTAENAMLKLALNGVYGDSNNKFSIFYDPLFTMSITLNGQLLLCLLAEQLMVVPDLRILQVNTDGITIRVRRESIEWVEEIRKAWEAQTRMVLEEKRYRMMVIADVNSYIAVGEDGSVKRKGRYEYDVEWHQNASALVVAKVAEQFLIRGDSILDEIHRFTDIMDYCLRVKVPRNSRLLYTDEHGEHQIQNTTRYYVAKGGGTLTKVMPPLKGKTEWRRFAIEKGWTVCVCNDMKDAVLPIDYDYYANEVEKLTLGAM